MLIINMLQNSTRSPALPRAVTWMSEWCTLIIFSALGTLRVPMMRSCACRITGEIRASIASTRSTIRNICARLKRVCSRSHSSLTACLWTCRPIRRNKRFIPRKIFHRKMNVCLQERRIDQAHAHVLGLFQPDQRIQVLIGADFAQRRQQSAQILLTIQLSLLTGHSISGIITSFILRTKDSLSLNPPPLKKDVPRGIR